MKITKGQNQKGEYLEIEVAEDGISYVLQQIWDGWLCLCYNHKEEYFTVLECFVGREVDNPFISALEFICKKLGL